MMWMIALCCGFAGFTAAVLFLGHMLGGMCEGEEKNFENGRLYERSKIAGYCVDLAEDLQANFESFDANGKKIIAENIQMLHSLAGDLRKYNSVDEMYTFDPRLFQGPGLDHEDGWGNPIGKDPFSIFADPPHRPVWTEVPDDAEDPDWDGGWGAHAGHSEEVDRLNRQMAEGLEEERIASDLKRKLNIDADEGLDR